MCKTLFSENWSRLPFTLLLHYFFLLGRQLFIGVVAFCFAVFACLGEEGVLGIVFEVAVEVVGVHVVLFIEFVDVVSIEVDVVGAFKVQFGQ